MCNLVFDDRITHVVVILFIFKLGAMHSDEDHLRPVSISTAIEFVILEASLAFTRSVLVELLTSVRVHAAWG